MGRARRALPGLLLLPRPSNGPTPPGATSPSRAAGQLQCLTLHSAGPPGRRVAAGRRAPRQLRSRAPARHRRRSEYSAPLIEPGPELPAQNEAAVARSRQARRSRRCCPTCAAGTPLADLLNGRPACGAHPISAAPAPFIARRDYADWPAYQKTLSGSLRHKLRRVRRRLAEKGAVTLGAEAPAAARPLIDWMLDAQEALARPSGPAQATGSAATTIATSWWRWPGRADARRDAVRAQDRRRADRSASLRPSIRCGFEAHIGVYDPQWSFYAPGQILTEHCLQLGLRARPGFRPACRRGALQARLGAAELRYHDLVRRHHLARPAGRGAAPGRAIVPATQDTVAAPARGAGEEHEHPPGPADQPRPWRRLRLQARPVGAAAAARRSAGRRALPPAAGRHRDLRRCRRLAGRRQHLHHRHHRFLHADGRRSVRFRPDRRDQRHLRRLCHGRQADHGARHPRHAGRQDSGRDGARDPEGRRRGLRHGRHSRSPAAIRSTAPSRSTAWP